MIRNFWIKYVLLMREPSYPIRANYWWDCVRADNIPHAQKKKEKKRKTSKFIINKQPQSLYHTQSLDSSVGRQGCCVSLGEAKGKQGEVRAAYEAGYGYQPFSYLAVRACFFFSYFGDGGSFKEYVNGTLTVGTKGVESSRGIWH